MVMARPLISSRTLRSLGRIAESAMLETGAIVRPRVIDDGAGGTKRHPDGPETITTPCSITAVGALPPSPLRDQVAEHGRYLLTVPRAKDLRVTDQFTVLGITYLVTWAPPPDALAVERMAALKEA
jgi:hypothetical protein